MPDEPTATWPTSTWRHQSSERPPTSCRGGVACFNVQHQLCMCSFYSFTLSSCSIAFHHTRHHRHHHRHRLDLLHITQSDLRDRTARRPRRILARGKRLRENTYPEDHNDTHYSLVVSTRSHSLSYLWVRISFAGCRGWRSRVDGSSAPHRLERTGPSLVHNYTLNAVTPTDHFNHRTSFTSPSRLPFSRSLSSRLSELPHFAVLHALIPSYPLHLADVLHGRTDPNHGGLSDGRLVTNRVPAGLGRGGCPSVLGECTADAAVRGTHLR